MSKTFYFTSESVTEGHPDKVADQISDAVLDEVIKNDKNCRVACETVLSRGIVFLSGEITTSSYVSIADIARDTIKEIGYIDPTYGFDYRTCGVLSAITPQSPDIAMGVNRAGEIGAGDQGMMFGYATDETPNFMPMPISLAHSLAMRLAQARKERLLAYLRPDGKTQVTVRYNNSMPDKVTAVVISTQHSPRVDMDQLKHDVKEEIIDYVISPEMADENMKIYINPTGRFVIGGPQADTGLTGRKIIVDAYGGVGSHGGGCFSGKDPTKVDRSASYIARYIAKNIVAAGIAKRCEIQLAYAIGVSEPVSLMVHTYGSSKVPKDRIRKMVQEVFPLTPKEIIEHLDLLRPIYKKTAAYGHFGRELPEFSWEKTDMTDIIRKKLL
ncbi:MAG: methionine adenosyltransferase [Epsilonproteobacteria bacterium]|nr:methionine adenosyltransferase [Campylobacterota bacterium]